MFPITGIILRRDDGTMATQDLGPRPNSSTTLTLATAPTAASPTLASSPTLGGGSTSTPALNPVVDSDSSNNCASELGEDDAMEIKTENSVKIEEEETVGMKDMGEESEEDSDSEGSSSEESSDKDTTKAQNTAQNSSTPTRNPRAAVAPKGTFFRWADNGHIDETPIKKVKKEADKVAQKAKTTLVLKSMERDRKTKQKKTYTYTFPGTLDMDKQESISAANRWRRQVLNRRLNRHGDGHAKESRQAWSVLEQKAIQRLIKEHVLRTKAAPTIKDFDSIGQKFNQRMAGQKLPKGSLLAAREIIKNGTKVMSVSGKKTTKDTTVPNRSGGAMAIMSKKWPIIAQTIDAALVEVGGGGSGSASSDAIGMTGVLSSGAAGDGDEEEASEYEEGDEESVNAEDGNDDVEMPDGE